MPETVKILNRLVNAIQLDDAPTSVTSAKLYTGGMDKLTFLINVVKTSTPTSVTFTVEVSPDDGTTWLSYDKLIDHSGADAPVASIAYTASTEDLCSLSLEDVLPWVRVIFTGAGTEATKYFTVDCWAVGR